MDKDLVRVEEHKVKQSKVEMIRTFQQEKTPEDLVKMAQEAVVVKKVDVQAYSTQMSVKKVRNQKEEEVVVIVVARSEEEEQVIVVAREDVDVVIEVAREDVDVVIAVAREDVEAVSAVAQEDVEEVIAHSELEVEAEVLVVDETVHHEVVQKTIDPNLVAQKPNPRDMIRKEIREVVSPEVLPISE